MKRAVRVWMDPDFFDAVPADGMDMVYDEGARSEADVPVIVVRLPVWVSRIFGLLGIFDSDRRERLYA